MKYLILYQILERLQIVTKHELIIVLNDYNDDDVVIISDGIGWSNIEEIEQQGSSIAIILERFPIFSYGD